MVFKLKVTAVLAAVSMAGCTTTAVRSVATTATPSDTNCSLKQGNCPVAYYRLPRTHLKLTVSRSGALDKDSESACEAAATAYAKSRSEAASAFSTARRVAITGMIRVAAAKMFSKDDAKKVADEFEGAARTAETVRDQLAVLADDYRETCWNDLDYAVVATTRYDGVQFALVTGDTRFASGDLNVTLSDNGLTKVTFSSDDQSLSAVESFVKVLFRSSATLDAGGTATGRNMVEILDIDAPLTASSATAPNPPTTRADAQAWTARKVELPRLDQGPFTTPLVKEAVVEPSKLRGADGAEILKVDEASGGADYGFKIVGKCPPVSRGAPPSSSGGVWVAAQTACSFSVVRLNGTRTVDQTVSTVFDDKIAVALPIHRTVFVKRETTYTLENGVLKEADLATPSSAAGLGTGLLSIVAAPVAAVKDALTDRKDLVEADTNRLKAEKELLSAQLALEEARRAARKKEDEPAGDEK